MLRFYFRGNKRQLKALSWFIQARPDMKLIDCRPIEVR